MLKETKTTEMNDYIVTNGHINQNKFTFANHNENDKIQSNEDKGPEDLRAFIAGEPFLPQNINPISSINNVMLHDKNNVGFYPPHPSFMPFMPASHCPNMFPMLFPLHSSLMHPLLPPAQFIFPPYNPTMHSSMVPMPDKNEMLNQNRVVQVSGINKVADMTEGINDKHQDRIELPFAPTSLNNLAISQSNANFELNANMFERVSNEYAKYLSSFPVQYSTMQSLHPLPINAFLPSYNPMLIPPSPMPVLGSYYSLPHPFLGQNLVGNPACGSMMPDLAKDPEIEEEDAKCRQEVASLFKNDTSDEKLSPKYMSNNFANENSNVNQAPKPFVDLNNNFLSEQTTYQDNENFYKYREVSKSKQRMSKDLNAHVNENGVVEENGDGEPSTSGAEVNGGGGHVTVPAGAEEEPLHKRMRVISLTQDEGATPATQPPTVTPPFVRTGDDRIFRKGSLIQLQNGDTRLVEQLTTRDFAKSCGVDPDYDIVKGEVLAIDRSSTARDPRGQGVRSKEDISGGDEKTPTAKITLAIRDTNGLLKEDNNGNISPPSSDATPSTTQSSPPTNTRVTDMEVRLSHLFFVPQPNNTGGGWASVSPERSLHELGLRCNQLRPGDDCLVVLAKNKNLLTRRHCSSNGKPVAAPRAAPCKVDRVVHGNHYDRLVQLKAKSQISSS